MARRRRTHRSLSIGSSHWRADGAPKVRYATQADAISVTEWRDDDLELVTYECDFCGGWHLASQGTRPKY